MAFTSASYLAFPPPGFGLEWFRTYLDSPIWISATVRSFAVAAGTAVLATVLGGFAALALTRASGRAQAAIFGLFITPMIVPHIVIAVGLFYVYTRFGLVGTDLGLVLGHTVFALPLAFLAITAMLKGYDRRLDQAAATLGANRLRTLAIVTIPLLRGGIIAALLFAFVTSFDDLTLALFTSGGMNTTLPKQMWEDMILTLNPTLAAVSVVVLAIIIPLLLVAERLRRSEDGNR
jgi:ABC-type spermidine/putrescine transport system permease subunit II